MKHILFPTDFSLSAQNAFLYAINIASKIDAKITLLHVVHSPIHVPKEPISEEVDNWLKEGNYSACFEEMTKILPPEIVSIPEVEKILQHGKTIETILKIINDSHPDLVVMGTKGADNLKSLFFGSHTSNLIEQTDVNVLEVPDEASFKDFNNIAFACDFQLITEAAIREVVDFAKKFDAEVHCFHVNISNNPVLEAKIPELAKPFEGEKVTFQLVEASYVPEGIEKFANKINADLIATYTHQYTPFQRIFQVSYTEKLVLHSELPLLAVKTRN